MKITKDMTIAEVLRAKPQTASIFMGIGMHCLGCPTASMETIEQAAEVHGVSVDELLAKLNQA